MSTFIDSMMRKIREHEEKKAPKAVIHRVGSLILDGLDCGFEYFLKYGGLVIVILPLHHCYYDPSDPERVFTKRDSIRGFCNIYDLRNDILGYVNELLKKLPFRVKVTWTRNEYDSSEFTIEKLE